MCSPAWRSSLQAAVQCSHKSCAVASRSGSSHQLSASSSNFLYSRVSSPPIASTPHPLPFSISPRCQRPGLVSLSKAAATAEAESAKAVQQHTAEPAPEPSSSRKESNVPPGSKVLLCRTEAQLEDIAVNLGEVPVQLHLHRSHEQSGKFKFDSGLTFADAVRCRGNSEENNCTRLCIHPRRAASKTYCIVSTLRAGL